jgi:hypothetical protein
MVPGIALQIAITAVLIVIAVYALKSMYLKGFISGMQYEAKAWAEAIGKVQPPNWQSLPVGEHLGYDKERIEGANKVYVAAFKVALEVIKEEIAANRIMALAVEFESGLLVKKPGTPDPGGVR